MRRAPQSTLPRCISYLLLCAMLMVAGRFACLVCCASAMLDDCCSAESAAAVEQAVSAESDCCMPALKGASNPCRERVSGQKKMSPCCVLDADTPGPGALPRFNKDYGTALSINEGSFATHTGAKLPQARAPVLLPDKGTTYLRCCVLLI